MRKLAGIFGRERRERSRAPGRRRTTGTIEPGGLTGLRWPSGPESDQGMTAAESAVGRALVWAEVATDEPLDLLVPAEGERARIVSVPGLVPVSQGRLCPNIFLRAWIPKRAILQP